MAYNTRPKLQSITTADILARLKEKGGDNTEFFYLYVSTAGKEQRRKQKRTRSLLKGQQLLSFTPQRNQTERDDPAEDDDEDDGTGNQDNDYDISMDNQDDELDDYVDDQGDRLDGQGHQSGANITSSTPQPSAASQSLTQDKSRQKTMSYVHNTILPLVLQPKGWKKVVDKDTKVTYRTLYFNIIEKYSDDEDVNTFTKRVGKIRHKIAEDVQKKMDEHQVNFKINSLRSKPFLYDEEALDEQSMSVTQTQPPGLKQTTLDDYQ